MTNKNNKENNKKNGFDKAWKSAGEELKKFCKLIPVVELKDKNGDDWVLEKGAKVKDSEKIAEDFKEIL